jgi:hypothetical protein
MAVEIRSDGTIAIVPVNASEKPAGEPVAAGREIVL